MTRLTASTLGRAVHCLHWAKETTELQPDRPGPRARIGTAVHFATERTLQGLSALFPDIAKRFELRPAEAREAEELFWAWDSWWNGPRGPGLRGLWQSEVAFALPPTGTAICLPQTKPRDYRGAPDGSIVGTADMIRVVDVVVEVRDIKTGQTAEEAAFSEQLRFLGAVAADAYGVPRASIWIDHVTESGVASSGHTLDATEIGHVLEDARALLRMIPTSEPVGGEWCRYCPSSHCPERRP